MRRWLILAVICSIAAAALVWLLDRPEVAPLSSSARSEPYSHEAFDQWVAEDLTRLAEYGRFVGFLSAHGVDSVVPAWQLTRTDANRSKDCERPQFVVPPREEWNNIVPVLRLVRDHVVPEIGAVEVQSSYRTLDFNECIGGARRSRHLNFSAVDLSTVEPLANRELFGRLCRLQARLGPKSRFGLGAYFNPEQPNRASGRFHVDVSGYRSWGYSKHAESSGCRAFR